MINILIKFKYLNLYFLPFTDHEYISFKLHLKCFTFRKNIEQTKK